METGQTCTFMVFLQKIGSNPHGNLSNYHSSRSQKYPWKPPNVGQKFNARMLLAIFRRKTPRPAWTLPAGRGINNQKAHFRSAGLLKSSHLLKAENPQPLPFLWERAVDFHSILRRLGALELQLEPVRDQGNKLTVRGLALGVRYRVAKEALQGVEIAPVPGYLDSVANGPLYPGRGGLEGFGHLGVENLGDGIRGLSAHAGGFQERRNRKGFIAFFIVPYSTALRAVVSIIAYSNFIVKLQPNKHSKL